ncbi:hypothetical protein NEOLEDRAFT_1143148, partial [Neolentinus lepideus HHB14362 ss-1]
MARSLQTVKGNIIRQAPAIDELRRDCNAHVASNVASLKNKNAEINGRMISYRPYFSKNSKVSFLSSMTLLDTRTDSVDRV